MNILIVGSGAREYAIGLRLKEDNEKHSLFFAPGNGATDKLGVNFSYENFDELVKFAKESYIDLTVVGPENELTLGIVDIFKDNDLCIFGPSKDAAKLEGSKAFMKEFLDKFGIRTAKFINTTSIDEAREFIQNLDSKIVVKADGLCAGKGVIIANSKEEALSAVSDMLSGSSFGSAGSRVVVEEFLDGFELSFFALCDGNNFVTLPVAQDHKRLLDGDCGPNTGGMGAYAPSPLANNELIARVENEIVRPTLDGMNRIGTPFCGVLFVGLMVVNNTPYVLEFNVRFGDPECEVLMPLIDCELGNLLFDAANGKLKEIKIKDKFAVGVVMASSDYPYKSSPKSEILIQDEPENSHIAYAGVSKIDNKIYATGGRVLVCVGMGDSIKDARDLAYKLCDNVKFKGNQYRKDIAYQALK